MSTAGPGPESVGPLPLSLGRPAPTSVPVPDWRERETDRGEEPKVAQHSSVSEKRLHSREGKASGVTSPPAHPPWPHAGHSAPTSDLQALSHRLHASLLRPYSCPVLPDGGLGPLAPSIHATLYLSSFYLGPSPPIPLPATPRSPLDGQLPSSCRVDGGVGSPKPESSALQALSKGSGLGVGPGGRAEPGRERPSRVLPAGWSPRRLPAPLHFRSQACVIPETCRRSRCKDRRSWRRRRGAGRSSATPLWQRL